MVKRSSLGPIEAVFLHALWMACILSNEVQFGSDKSRLFRSASDHVYSKIRLNFFLYKPSFLGNTSCWFCEAVFYPWIKQCVLSWLRIWNMLWFIYFFPCWLYRFWLRQLEDRFTKPLPNLRFSELRNKMGIRLSLSNSSFTAFFLSKLRSLQDISPTEQIGAMISSATNTFYINRRFVTTGRLQFRIGNETEQPSNDSHHQIIVRVAF